MSVRLLFVAVAIALLSAYFSVDTSPPTLVTERNEQGRVVCETEVNARGQRHGMERCYFPNGRVSTIRKFEHGQPIEEIYYREDGTIRTRAFENMLYQQVIEHYDSDGRLTSH